MHFRGRCWKGLEGEHPRVMERCLATDWGLYNMDVMARARPDIGMWWIFLDGMGMVIASK